MSMQSLRAFSRRVINLPFPLNLNIQLCFDKLYQALLKMIVSQFKQIIFCAKKKKS